MNALYTVRLTLASLLACLLLAVAATTPVEAQTKKKKATTTTQQPKVRQQPAQQQTEEETSGDEPQQQQAVEEEEKEPTPPPQAKVSTAQPANFKDLLRQYVGHKTNLGTLKKITNDYVVFEDENTTAMYRLDVIHSIQVIKEEEQEPRIEIKVLSKD